MIGIAIVNYNTYEKTIECINSIKETLDEEYKIYLLENGSENESTRVLQKEYDEDSNVKLIISEENLGYAKGNNKCIEAMIKEHCEYGVIANNDIICTKNSIQELVNSLKKHSDYFLVGPRIVSPEGEYQRSIKLKEYGRLEYINKSTYFSKFHKRSLKKEQKKIESIANFEQVCWVSGAFFAFDVEKMQNIGCFDPTTFLFFEEYILYEKAKSKGYKFGYNPRSKVIHYHAYSTGGGYNIVSKIAADKSERYYMSYYRNYGKVYLTILGVIRRLEVWLTFGKRKDFSSLKKYKREIRNKLEKR